MKLVNVYFTSEPELPKNSILDASECPPHLWLYPDNWSLYYSRSDSAIRKWKNAEDAHQSGLVSFISLCHFKFRCGDKLRLLKHTLCHYGLNKARENNIVTGVSKVQSIPSVWTSSKQTSFVCPKRLNQPQLWLNLDGWKQNDDMQLFNNKLVKSWNDCWRTPNRWKISVPIARKAQKAWERYY
jgi:hypothetical protein